MVTDPQTAPYGSVHLDEIAPIPDEEGQEWRPIRHVFDITAHGVTAWTGLDAGARILDDHDEADCGHEELYIVLRGRARFVLDGAEQDAPTGTLVFVRDPNVRRTAFAVEAGTTILATGGLPGAFSVSDWEKRYTEG